MALEKLRTTTKTLGAKEVWRGPIQGTITLESENELIRKNSVEEKK